MAQADKLIESQKTEQSVSGRGNLPEAPSQLNTSPDFLDTRIVDNFDVEAFLNSPVTN